MKKVVIAIVMVLSLSLMSSLSGISYSPVGKCVPSTAQAVSIGKTNALIKAKQYLNYTAFSKKGLKKQLKFEGYTSKEADYGVKHCGANWKKQAVKKAKQYLNYSAFSKKGLYKQLLFEGFTKKQAKYAVKKAYK
ncbi:MAG: Ltp family lipoprotein [Eubacterium sp.]|nr:Ltp family lipoprotein [Eubacterium sp.]